METPLDRVRAFCAGWTLDQGAKAHPVVLSDNHHLALALEDLLAVVEQTDELEAYFDLRWKADLRAITRWREATGQTMVLPDHADLCVWLIEQLDAATRKEEKLMS